MKNKKVDRKLWTKPSCANCILNISYLTLMKSTNDKKLQHRCIEEMYVIMKQFKKNAFTTDFSNKIFRMLQDLTKNEDPYNKEKKLSNKLGNKVSEQIKQDINKSTSFFERIYKAIIGSIIGNVIDFSTAQHEFSLDFKVFNKLYAENLKQGFKINDFQKFITLLDRVKTVLYVLDNAGEVAFDKLLIAELLALDKKVIAVLKEGPIVNDATLADAYQVGLNKLNVELITTGTNALGVMFNELSEDFIAKLNSSDLIISKGQANWESFTYFEDYIKIPILFILKAKCSPIAEFIGVEVGDNVLKLINKTK